MQKMKYYLIFTSLICEMIFFCNLDVWVFFFQMEETDNVELNLKCSGESRYLQQVSLLPMLMHRLILSKCMYVDFSYEMLRNYI